MPLAARCQCRSASDDTTGGRAARGPLWKPLVGVLVRLEHVRTAGRGAFSLIELVVVMFLIGVVAVVAQPKLMSYVQNERVRALNHRIKMDLTMARSEAIKRRTPVTLRFDPSGTFYEIPQMTNTYTLDGVQTAYRVALKGDGGFQAEVVSVDFGGTAEVTYDAFGTPDSTGTIVIGNGSTYGLMTVQSDGTLGKMTLQDSIPGGGPV